MLTLLRFSSYFLLALTAALAGTRLASVPNVPIPRLGRRGIERARAMRHSSLFTILDPLLRFLAGLLSYLPINPWRVRQELELRRAGYWLGLAPDEYTALAVLCAVGVGVVLGASARLLALDWDLTLPGAVMGFVWPRFRVREVIRTRVKVICRALPQAIESVSMCMGAGLDFPGSLRMLLNAETHRDALVQEFESILEELELGHTRREALLNFAGRVQSPAVHDFVRAIVQAEQKGNPLARALRIQGLMLRLRRSVAAEEAAARAAVLMIGPMMLLLGCILLLLMGPFLVKGVGI